MLVYLAHSIDRATENNGVSEARRSLEDAGATLFDPMEAFGNAKLCNSRGIEAINRHAIDEADMVVARVKGESIGVPMEIQYAVSINKPTVIVHERSFSISLSALEGLRHVRQVSLSQFASRSRGLLAWAKDINAVPDARSTMRTAGEYKLEKAHQTDAGFDLYTSESTEVKANSINPVWVPCGIWAELPKGTFGWVVARSSTARTWSLHVMPGVIDYGYQGELGVNVVPTRVHPFDWSIPAGTRLAQLVVMPVTPVSVRSGFSRVELNQGSARGANGFGSTGL